MVFQEGVLYPYLQYLYSRCYMQHLYKFGWCACTMYVYILEASEMYD